LWHVPFPAGIIHDGPYFLVLGVRFAVNSRGICLRKMSQFLAASAMYSTMRILYQEIHQANYNRMSDWFQYEEARKYSHLNDLF